MGLGLSELALAQRRVRAQGWAPGSARCPPCKWRRTSMLPPALKQQLKTTCVCPRSVRRHAPVSALHSLALRSSEAVASSKPSPRQHTSEMPCAAHGTWWHHHGGGGGAW